MQEAIYGEDRRSTRGMQAKENRPIRLDGRLQCALVKGRQACPDDQSGFDFLLCLLKNTAQLGMVNAILCGRIMEQNNYL